MQISLALYQDLLAVNQTLCHYGVPDQEWYKHNPSREWQRHARYAKGRPKPTSKKDQTGFVKDKVEHKPSTTAKRLSSIQRKAAYAHGRPESTSGKDGSKDKPDTDKKTSNAGSNAENRGRVNNIIRRTERFLDIADRVTRHVGERIKERQEEHEASKPSNMTTEELEAAVKRKKLEKEYRELTKRPESFIKKSFNKLAEKAVNVAVDAAGDYLSKQLQIKAQQSIEKKYGKDWVSKLWPNNKKDSKDDKDSKDGTSSKGTKETRDAKETKEARDARGNSNNSNSNSNNNNNSNSNNSNSNSNSNNNNNSNSNNNNNSNSNNSNGNNNNSNSNNNDRETRPRNNAGEREYHGDGRLVTLSNGQRVKEPSRDEISRYARKENESVDDWYSRIDRYRHMS